MTMVAQRTVDVQESQAVPVKRWDADIPNPHVALNEYPNPPWNTVAYEWDAEYDESSPEWHAQKLAKFAARYGLTYGTRDRAAEQRAYLKQYLQERERVASTDKRQGRDIKRNVTHHASTYDTANLSVNSVTLRDEQHNGDVTLCSDDPMKVVNGVLTDTHLYYKVDGKVVKKRLTSPIEHIGHVMQLCLDCHLDMICVLAPSAFSSQATKNYVDTARSEWEISRVQYTRKGLCYFLSGWKKRVAVTSNETGDTVNVFYAAHNTDWNMQKVDDPVTLLAAITYVEDAVKYPVRFKPSHVGKMIMGQENDKRKKEWIRPINLSDNKIVCNTQVDAILWKRPLNESERTQEYLLAFDKNMQHTASCTGLMVGAGMPTHVTRPTFDMKKSLPGVWYCNISGTSDFDGVGLPHPTNGVTHGWFWTYTVKLLHEVGYQVEITEAWVWEEAHDTLRDFGTRMWEARNTLRENVERYPHQAARSIAENAVKSIANTSMGLLGHAPKNTDSPNAYDWYRPDWWWLIIDNARYQMFWRIRSYLKFGYAPIGVHTDCLYYISDIPEHDRALTGTTQRKGQEVTCNMMERSGKLGGYKQKHKGVTITREYVEPLFDNVKLDILQVNDILLTHEREQVAQKER